MWFHEIFYLTLWYISAPNLTVVVTIVRLFPTWTESDKFVLYVCCYFILYVDFFSKCHIFQNLVWIHFSGLLIRSCGYHFTNLVGRHISFLVLGNWKLSIKRWGQLPFLHVRSESHKIWLSGATETHTHTQDEYLPVQVSCKREMYKYEIRFLIAVGFYINSWGPFLWNSTEQLGPPFPAQRWHAESNGFVLLLGCLFLDNADRVWRLIAHILKFISQKNSLTLFLYYHLCLLLYFSAIDIL